MGEVAVEFGGCWECGKALPEGPRKRQFCSKACSTRFNDRRFPEGPQAERARHGAAAEMLVAADLLARHKDVLSALNPHGGFDLAVLVGGGLE